MENITGVFNDTYSPTKALLIYQSATKSDGTYVEAYDINSNGKPINAHPLSLMETIALAESLNTSTGLQTNYLQSKGLLPDKVLHIQQSAQGFAIWNTPEQEVNLLFTESLQIPCGKAYIPPLVWKANKSSLFLYAVKERKTSLKTALLRAPFFNLNDNGSVCMGTVDTGMEKINNLEDFMAAWEHCYWNSYFSHLITGVSPVKENIVQLWQSQVNSGKKFPLEALTETGQILKNIIV